MRRRHFLLSFFVMMVIPLTLISSTSVHAGRKKYTVRTDLTFAPFEFQDSKERYVGTDTNLLDAIAKDQDFEMDLKLLGLDNAVQAIQSKQIDSMTAGMNITDERKRSFDFSDPCFDNGLQLTVKKRGDKIKSCDSLKDKTVVAKVGTGSADFLEKNKEKYDYTIKDSDDVTGLYEALENDEANAIVDDYPVLGYVAKNGQKLQLVGDKETGSSYGFTAEKGQSPGLVKKFNVGLKNLKDDGTYDKILSNYLATGDETSTQDADEQVKKITPKREKYVVVSGSTLAPFEF